MLFLSIALNEKKLHIISFDNPFPADYGGVIDVFYKIKALHQHGIKIYLHCFYQDRNHVSETLKKYTEAVYLYPKKRKISYLFSSFPMSVISRFDKKILDNISKIKAPILIEGLQSSMIVNYLDVNKSDIYLRLHNLESNYYAGMGKNETSFLKKWLYKLEAKKYKKYEEKISLFKHVFSLSSFEFHEVRRKNDNQTYLPVFHGNEVNSNLSQFGEFALYHGDLRLADNKKAASFCISLFKKITDYKLIIASSNGKDFIENLIEKSPNIEFIELKDNSHLEELLEKAHINILMSFQKSGTKLKIIKALHRSRFCLINQNMVDDEKILDLCTLANTEKEFTEAIQLLKYKPYSDNDRRKTVLKKVYDDSENAQTLINTIWKI